MSLSLTSQRRTQALFKAFDGDFLLREQFVTDPAQVLAEYVDGARLPADTALAANRMVYAVLSSPALLSWVQSYSAAHRSALPDEQQFDSDFAQAIASSGDDEVVHALIAGAKNSQNVFAAQSSLLRALIGILGSSGSTVASTEMSPGTATEQSPGVTATEISPGAFGRAEFGQVFAETEMSPGTATEQSPGVTATEISPGAFQRAEFGQVFAETEMSPGTATEQSPGVTATEISPGSRFGFVDISATFGALVQFANELRAAGALRTLGAG